MSSTQGRYDALGWLLVAAAIVLAILVLVAPRDSVDTSYTRSWNVYHGDAADETFDFRAVLDESDRGYGYGRMLHLYPAGYPGYVSLTGHDHAPADGAWDKVFFCGSWHPLIGEGPHGCNSVTRTVDGWEFEACPADEGKVEPFSDELIQYGIATLDAAIHRTNGSLELHESWRWDEEEQRLVKTFPPSDTNS